MKRKILVFHRKQPKQDGTLYDRYFMYGLDDKEEIIVNPDTGNPRSFKVVIADEVFKVHNLTNNMFPVIMVVDDEATLQVTTKDGESKEVSAFRFKTDRDKSGKIRRDDMGNPYILAKINQVVEIREAPRKSISWDEMFDINLPDEA